MIVPTLYFLPTDGMIGDETVKKLFLRVSPKRRGKVARLRREADRRNALLAALLVRMAACEQLGCANADLTFAGKNGGKPYLCGADGFHFSISHTEGAAIAAICGAPCGADVEKLRSAPRGVAERFFTEAERRYAGNSDARFFEIWTRKEAYVKRCGGSLAGNIALTDVLAPRIASDTRVFNLSTHIAALCAEDAATAELCPLDLDGFLTRAIVYLSPLD